MTILVIDIKLRCRCIQSYSPCGTNVYPHITHGFLGPCEKCTHKCILIGSAVFAMLTGVPNTHTHTHTHDGVSPRGRRIPSRTDDVGIPHVIGVTCDGQTDQCARRMVCRRRRKSTSPSLLLQQGPSWPSAWRQELLCASPRKPIWHLSSTVSRHSCQGVQSATRKEPDRTLVG